jgi:hypothetical protein
MSPIVIGPANAAAPRSGPRSCHLIFGLPTPRCSSPGADARANNQPANFFFNEESQTMLTGPKSNSRHLSIRLTDYSNWRLDGATVFGPDRICLLRAP